MKGLKVLMLFFAVACADDYEGYKVYHLTPQNEAQVQVLKTLSENEKYDFWTPLRRSKHPTDVMIGPEQQKEFEEILLKHKVEYKVKINNVRTAFDNERRVQQTSGKSDLGSISFQKFNRHKEINAYLDELAKDFPEVVKIETIGQSFEERDMKVIRISKNPKAEKPAIFIDAGIHAREWAASAVALYIIHQLVENPEHAHLIEEVDWHILPSVNPDGYEYSHEHDRLWRKTVSSNEICKGADANRNFGFHWGEVGSSSYSCSAIYHGKSAFSEVEAQNLRDYVLKYKKNLKLYLSFHSYGCYLLYPWGYTDQETPDNAQEHKILGDKVAEAIEKYNGTIYDVGCTTALLYPVAGGSRDWAKAVAGIDFAYTVELPGGGEDGFDPPPTQILPIVKETWEGVKVFYEYIATKYSNKSN